MSGEDETGKAAELGRVLGAGQQRVGHRVGNTKQPLPDSAADAVIKKEWLTDGFGANSQNFFAERQKRGTSAAAVGFEHYTMGGGNTPYVQRRSDARAERGSICIQCVRMNAVMSTVSSRHNLCGLT